MTTFTTTKLDWLKATRFDRRVTDVAHRVAGVIVDHLSETTGCAFLAADTIAFESGKSRRAVVRAVALLRRLGYLESRRTRAANVYRPVHRHVKSALQMIGHARGEKRAKYLERKTDPAQMRQQRLISPPDAPEVAQQDAPPVAHKHVIGTR